MEARKRMGKRLGAARSRSSGTRIRTQTMDTAGIAEFGYFGTGNLSLTGPNTKVCSFGSNARFDIRHDLRNVS